MMVIPMCAKISGAHYNPAVTVSNSLCLYNRNKYNWDLIWMYFKAQLYSATFALALGYILNDNFLAGLALTTETTNLFRIFLSELLATAILVFYTQLVANS
jgi:glycerol uptake facilitator-like aquaporin